MRRRTVALVLAAAAAGIAAAPRHGLPPAVSIAMTTADRDRGADSTPVLVPSAAVRADGRVLVVEKEVVRVRAVELGARASNAVEVRRGLSPGEAVVLEPPATLADGQRVRLRL